MHIVFILSDSLDINRDNLLFTLTNKLILDNHKVTMFTPLSQKANFNIIDSHNYNTLSFCNQKRLEHQGDIIFIAWTPKEIIRNKVISLSREYNAPYYVYLKENEDLFSNYNKSFLTQSDGVICETKELESMIPKETPAITLWPINCIKSTNIFFDSESNKLKELLGIKKSIRVIIFPEDNHSKHEKALNELHKAVSIINSKEKNVLILKIKIDLTEFKNFIHIQIHDQLHKEKDYIKGNLEYLSLGDIIVIPNSENKIEDSDFPNNLPIFLMSRLPILISELHLKDDLVDMENCIKYVKGDADELAHKIELLLGASKLSNEIGINGRAFAIKNFDQTKYFNNFINFIYNTRKKNQKK